MFKVDSSSYSHWYDIHYSFFFFLFPKRNNFILNLNREDFSLSLRFYSKNAIIRTRLSQRNKEVPLLYIPNIGKPVKT